MAKEDLRIRRTKKQLYDSLLKLLETTEFNNIKVIDVCKLSNINRSTFYDHFDKKEDLLVYISDELKDELLNYLDIDYNYNNKKEYLLEVVDLFLEFINNYKKTIKTINNDELISNRFYLVIKTILNKNLSEEDSIFYSGAISKLCLDKNLNKNKILEYLNKELKKV